MELADRVVLEAFERDILRQDIIEKAIARAARLLNPSPDRAAATQARVSRELEKVEGELRRLTAALLAGGALETITEAIRDHEQRRSAGSGRPSTRTHSPPI